MAPSLLKYSLPHTLIPISIPNHITYNDKVIDLLFSVSYLMSLYLCDWDNNYRKQTIHIFDMDTLNIIAPIVYNADYFGGKWIQYKLDRSVRIRMNFVRGTNAILSGIFFD